VSAASFGSSERAPRTTSARAQSMVSEIDGALRKSISRIFWTKETRLSARSCSMSGTLSTNDGELAQRGRVVEVEMQAPAPERVGHFAHAVAREKDERAVCRAYGPDLGDGHLELAQHLEQKSLELGVRAIDFIDEEHRGDRALQRREQGRAMRKRSLQNVASLLATRSAASASDVAPATSLAITSRSSCV